MDYDQNSFFNEVADDFFAECDEILSAIRKNLLLVDGLKGEEKPPRHVLEELMRSFHTLKGLSGMLGAANILNITHALESFLKTAYENHLPISLESLDIVIEGVRTTELMLNAYRNKTEHPDHSMVLRKIDNLVAHQVHGNAVNEDEKDDVPDIKGNGSKWKFIFTPSRELYEKGININVVRDRITSLGKVISSRPKSLGDGKIAFEFEIFTQMPENSFSEWRDDGISFEKLEEEKPSSKDDKNKRAFTHKSVVRVELSRLDEIMRTVGDLVISRVRLNEHLAAFRKGKVHGDVFELHEINMLIERQLKDLRGRIMKLRLVPVGEAFERLRFIVRDLIRESRKTIRLETEGAETQIDKYIMEKMFDPLIHIVRNAVSHGIESPAERKAAGKPPEAILSLKASAFGDSVVFEIKDDGRGIDRKRIIEKALKAGLMHTGDQADDDTLLEIMGSPGFSTLETTDKVSGRGVGMNVVKKSISELGGTMTFVSDQGKGTNFIIRLPLTLSIVDALIVSVGNSVFAFPLPAVNEVVRFERSELIRIENNEMLPYRDVVLPVLMLNDFFNIPGNGRSVYDALVIGQGEDAVGIAVDKVVGQREIVVRSLPDPVVQVDGISGATELGEGKVVLIVDPRAVIRSAVRKKQKTQA